MNAFTQALSEFALGVLFMGGMAWTIRSVRRNQRESFLRRAFDLGHPSDLAEFQLGHGDSGDVVKDGNPREPVPAFWNRIEASDPNQEDSVPVNEDAWIDHWNTNIAISKLSGTSTRIDADLDGLPTRPYKGMITEKCGDCGLVMPTLIMPIHRENSLHGNPLKEKLAAIDTELSVRSKVKSLTYATNQEDRIQ